jgi:hypothetical protein
METYVCFDDDRQTEFQLCHGSVALCRSILFRIAGTEVLRPSFHSIKDLSVRAIIMKRAELISDQDG